MTLKTSLLLTALLSVSAAAIAQDAGQTPFQKRMQARQERQSARIEAGTASGSLTPREAVRLNRQETHIQSAEQKALSDGTLSAGEKNRIEHMQDAQSRRIAAQNHDRQHDFDHNGRADRPGAHPAR